ncbi:MAG: YbaB/EbfC family nucleoid-associated protein [Pseudomonadota bacterium]
MINMKQMMQQAQLMQERMQELQEKLKDIYVEGESGGGMVKVEMSCSGDVRSIKIDHSVVSADDTETLEDLVLAALNNTTEIKDERIKAETAAMMESLGLPADAQLPGM